MEEKDTRITEVLKSFGRTTRRRGFLSQSWKLILRVLGISLVPLLPVDKGLRRVEAANSCDDFQNCGMCGVPCWACGGSAGGCPTGCTSTLGNTWNACCCPDLGPMQEWRYVDCCGPSSSCTSCDSEPEYCTGGCGIPGMTSWCPSGTAYKCTKRAYLGQC